MAKLGQVQHFNKPLEDAMGFSAIVHANGLLHLAGIISVDEQAQIVGVGDMAVQMARIYDIMEETLAKNRPNPWPVWRPRPIPCWASIR